MLCLGFEQLSPKNGEKQSQEHSQKANGSLWEIACIKESNTIFKGTAPGLLSPSSWKPGEFPLIRVFSPMSLTAVLLESDTGHTRYLLSENYFPVRAGIKGKMLTFRSDAILYHLKNGFNDHFKEGWKILNFLLLPGSLVRLAGCGTASQGFWHFTDGAGELGNIIYPFFAAVGAGPKGWPPAEGSHLPIAALEGGSSPQRFTAAAQKQRLH